MRVIDVIGDSRVRHLYGPLKWRYSGTRDVTAIPGATIHRLSTEVASRAQSVSPPDAVILMGGICSVTRRSHHTGNLSLRIPCTHYASLKVVDSFDKLLACAHGWNPNMKVMACELFGVNFQRTNNLPGPFFHPHQLACNEIVRVVNDRLAVLNDSYQLLTPATADICHGLDVDGNYESDYSCLDDGCHPGSEAINELADTISLCLIDSEVRGLI